MKENNRMKLIITGGGTGGHIYPALSIADAFRREYPEGEVLYIGTKNGMESTIVPAYGYRFQSIEVQGLKRKLTAENLLRGYKAFRALSFVRRILKEEKPDLVIGTGGYVSGPVVLSAAMMKIPTAIHEQNVFPGMTNRFLSRWTDLVFLGFEKARPRFDRAKRIVCCGNPIRTERFSVTKEEAREKIGIPKGMPMIFSVGGSGGSPVLNRAVTEILPFLVSRDIALCHVSGKIHYTALTEKLLPINRSPYQKITAYLDDIAPYMSAADIIVGSAGAISLAEISYLGKPSIIVPKAYTAENHQEYNGRMIEDTGAGYCILEKDLTGESLQEKIEKILNDGDLRCKMEENSRKLSQEDPGKIVISTLKALLFEGKEGAGDEEGD